MNTVEAMELAAENDYFPRWLRDACAAAAKDSKDAERHRWWKARLLAYECAPPSVIFSWPAGVAFRFDDVDASVDAAMAAEPAVGDV